MVRILIAAVISAIAMFVWGFLFWGPVMNMTAKLVRPLPADQELNILAPMRASQMKDGMYVYPGPPPAGADADAQAAWEKKMSEGPIVNMSFHAEGVNPMDPKMFALGLGHSFVVALLAGAALAIAAPGLPTFGRRFGALALLVIAASLWTTVGNMIWWGHSSDYTLGQVAYHLGAGLLMAAITAAIVRPRAEQLPAGFSRDIKGAR